MELEAYRQFAELEENHFWFIGRREIFFHLIDKELAGTQGLRVLEIGCGAGGMMVPLSKYGTVTGIDISPDIIAFCRARGLESVLVGSGYDLPIQPGSMDLVALFDTIEHIPDDARVLEQCHRTLKPGGLLFVSVPAYQFLYSNNDRVAQHQRRYTRGDLRNRLERAGFTVTTATYFNTLLFPMILPTVLAKKAKERFVDVGDTTNLSHEYSPRVNTALARVMSSERRLLTKMEFPFGHSIIAMARR
ncbi:MAG: class I SAM-dependent methyltransferase [Acidimicrobiales bacterium]